MEDAAQVLGEVLGLREEDLSEFLCGGFQTIELLARYLRDLGRVFDLDIELRLL